jgi:hypothetical protein
MKKEIVDITAQREYVAAKSEEMKKTVTGTPAWLIRYGLSAFFITLLILAGFGTLLKFPERVAVPATVSTSNGERMIRVWMDEKSLPLVKADQEVTVTIKEASGGNNIRVKGKTGRPEISMENKNFVTVIPVNTKDLQQLTDDNPGEAFITYNKRTLLQQILDVRH